MLLLTGPPGCGKTATIQILAKDLGIQVQEWTNPISLDFTKEDLRNMFGHGKYFVFFLFFLSFQLLLIFVCCGFFYSFVSLSHMKSDPHLCKSDP